MKKLLAFILALSFLSTSINTQAQIKETMITLRYNADTTLKRDCLYYQPYDYVIHPNKLYPVIFCWHGAGESQKGSPAGSTLYNNTSAGMYPYVIEHGVWPDSVRNPFDGQYYEFIVISMFSNNGWSTTGDEMDSVINDAMRHYRIDPTRIYGTGLSAGGAGLVEYLSRLDATETVGGRHRTHLYAAVAPMSEASNAIQLPWAQTTIADSNRVWCWGNIVDTHGAISSDYIAYMKFVRDGYGRFSPYTECTPTGGHGCWNFIYDPSRRETFTWKNATGATVTSNMNILEWFLVNQRSSTVNISCNAGSPQTITLPTNAVTLSGTANPSTGKTITAYHWSQISGPNTATFTAVNSQTTNANNLIAGGYVFQLQATDNLPSSATSTVAITVNGSFHQPPNVTVSPNQSIALTATAVPLTSSASANGGALLSTIWTKLPFNQPGIKVGILGSSTSVGTGSTIEDSSYVGRFLAWGILNGVISSVLNLANGGADIGSALATGTISPTGLSAPDVIRNVTAMIAAGGVKVVILNFPTNAYDNAAVTPAVVGQVAQQIVNSLAAAGIECYVTTSQSRVDFTQPVQDKLKVIRDTILNRFGTHAIDFYNGLTIPGTTQQIANYAYGDGIHFNNLGHSRLFEIVKARNIFQNLVTKTSVIQTPNTPNTLVTISDSGRYVYQMGVMDDQGLASSATTMLTVGPPASTVCHGIRYTITPDPFDSSYFQEGGYNPGDTLILNDGGKAFTNVVFTELHGTTSCPIVIMNNPTAGRYTYITGARAQIALGNCTHVKVTGSGIPGVQYGFTMDGYPGKWTADAAGGSYFGYVTSGRSANIEWDHVSTRHAAVGFEVKQDGDCDPLYIFPNWVMDSVSIHDCQVLNPWNEGMYIGNTSPDNAVDSYDPRPVICDGIVTYPRPIRIGQVHIYNNRVDSTGRGGIQVASSNGIGTIEIDHNEVSHNGWSGDDAQGTGISCGTYTSPYIHDNYIHNTFTWPIASIGGGITNRPLRIENNRLDSAGYMQYYIDPIAYTVGANTLQWPVAIELITKQVDSVPSFDSTQFYIKNNVIGLVKNIDGYFATLDDEFVRMQMSGNFICGNTYFNGSAATSVFNNGCAPCIPYFSTCTGFTPPIVDASGNRTITLPVSSVTLPGSAIPQAPATITSYLWAQVSGPNTATITGGNTATATMSNLIVGTYQFKLTATDSNTLSSTASVMVVVNPAAAATNKIQLNIKRILQPK